MASEYNFDISKGSSLTKTFEYKNSDNTPINLTNWQARISVQPLDGPNTSVITYISDNQDTIYYLVVQASTGRIVFKLPSSTTSEYTFSTALYDLDLKAPNELYPGAGDQIVQLLRGTITILNPNIIIPEVFIPKPFDPDECASCE